MRYIIPITASLILVYIATLPLQKYDTLGGKTAATKEEEYLAQHGTYQQVLEKDAEAYFGKTLSHPTRVDVFDGPRGKWYEIVRTQDEPTATGTAKVEHVVPLDKL